MLLTQSYKLILCFREIFELSGDEAATVEVNLFVVLDATKGADHASKWTLKDADLATDVVEGLAIWYQGHATWIVINEFAEDVHVQIRDNDNVGCIIHILRAHVVMQVAMVNEGDEPKVADVGTGMLQAYQSFLSRVHKYQILHQWGLDNLVSFYVWLNLLAEWHVIFDFLALKVPSHLHDMIVSHTHREPMQLLVTSSM